MTFSLDEDTVRRINRIASRLSKPKSTVVSEAIHDYDAKSDRLTEAERARMLKILKEIMKQPPTRSSAETDRELRELRESRRMGWMRPSERR